MSEADLIKRLDALEVAFNRLHASIEVPVWKIAVPVTVAGLTIDFTDIPQSAINLRLIGSLRTDRAAANTDGIGIRFNGSAAALYDYAAIYGSGAAPAGERNNADTSALIGYATGATATAGYFGSLDISIADYRAAKAPSFTSTSGYSYADAAGNTFVETLTGKFRTAGAVTRITLISRNGANFIAGCTAVLYGW